MITATPRRHGAKGERRVIRGDQGGSRLVKVDQGCRFGFRTARFHSLRARRVVCRRSGWFLKGNQSESKQIKAKRELKAPEPMARWRQTVPRVLGREPTPWGGTVREFACGLNASLSPVARESGSNSRDFTNSRVAGREYRYIRLTQICKFLISDESSFCLRTLRIFTRRTSGL